MWFSEIAGTEDPGRNELSQFIGRINEFFFFVLENTNDFSFLWEDDPELQPLAMETFKYDVSEGAAYLQQMVPEIPEHSLISHGLLGRPMRFKLRVLDAIGRKWEIVRGQFSVREWLKQIFEAIDAILDSLIDAAGGAGSLIKEFKDALSSLVKVT